MIQVKSNQDDQRELQDAIATCSHHISVIYRQSCTCPAASCVGQKWGFRWRFAVITAVGRIDLLTESEVIEIKNIDDWKEVLGKILAYSAFFPTHAKRVHLFGKLDLGKLSLAKSTCFEFDITVTFEEVK